MQFRMRTRVPLWEETPGPGWSVSSWARAPSSLACGFPQTPHCWSSPANSLGGGGGRALTAKEELLQKPVHPPPPLEAHVHPSLRFLRSGSAPGLPSAFSAAAPSAPTPGPSGSAAPLPRIPAPLCPPPPRCSATRPRAHTNAHLPSTESSPRTCFWWLRGNQMLLLRLQRLSPLRRDSKNNYLQNLPLGVYYSCPSRAPLLICIQDKVCGLKGSDAQASKGYSVPSASQDSELQWPRSCSLESDLHGSSSLSLFPSLFSSLFSSPFLPACGIFFPNQELNLCPL